MRKLLVCLLAIAGSQFASAAVCDYAPSKLVGAPVAGSIATGAGTIGSVGAVLLSPFVIIPAAITAGAIVTYEGGCYLAEKDKK